MARVYVDRWVAGPDGKPELVRVQRVTENDQTVYYAPTAPHWGRPDPRRFEAADTAGSRDDMQKIIDRKKAAADRAAREAEEEWAGMFSTALTTMTPPERRWFELVNPWPSRPARKTFSYEVIILEDKESLRLRTLPIYNEKTNNRRALATIRLGDTIIVKTEKVETQKK